jgi:hypothetical protein
VLVLQPMREFIVFILELGDTMDVNLLNKRLNAARICDFSLDEVTW